MTRELRIKFIVIVFLSLLAVVIVAPIPHKPSFLSGFRIRPGIDLAGGADAKMVIHRVVAEFATAAPQAVRPYLGGRVHQNPGRVKRRGTEKNDLWECIPLSGRQQARRMVFPPAGFPDVVFL